MQHDVDGIVKWWWPTPPSPSWPPSRLTPAWSGFHLDQRFVTGLGLDDGLSLPSTDRGASPHPPAARRQPVRARSASPQGCAGPTGLFKPQAFLATDPDVTLEAMLGWFVSGWQVEVTFQEVRAHPGVETRCQWSDLAIARTTPALLDLFSPVALRMNDLVKAKRIAPQATAWYRKTRLTFADASRAARREVWVHQPSPDQARTV